MLVVIEVNDVEMQLECARAARTRQSELRLLHRLQVRGNGALI